MNQSYWRGPAEDEAMQDEHGFVWKAMLDSIDTDLADQRVLDVGCNRGGFLRLLVDRCAIGKGFGYDPAAGAIEDARKLAGGAGCILRPTRRCRLDGATSTGRSATRCCICCTTCPRMRKPCSPR